MSAVADTPGVSGASAANPSFKEALRVWLKIGLINFGGPAGQIALMHKTLVEEKRWIDEPRFLHALNYCMLLPGPEAQQLATYVGWLLHGTRGGIVAGTLFILPGFLLILALSAAYVTFADVAAVQGVLFGLKAAVLAVVAEALVRIGRRALKTRAMLAVAVAAFAAIAFFRVPFPLIVAASALAGLLLARADPGLVGLSPKSSSASSAAEAALPPGSFAALLRNTALWGAVWLLPVLLLAAALGGSHIFVQEALFFSKVAVVTFGGAYAVLAYVAQQAVEAYRWLAPDEMLTGLGLAETTPGPLILVLVFVGFLAGARGATGLDPLAAGLIGGTITAWVTFAPSFLFIFAGAPFVERLRGNKLLAGALAAVTFAVVGVIANLALWFGLHVLFRDVTETRFGLLRFPVPDAASFEWVAALIAALAGLALIRLHLGIFWVLGGATLVGVLAHL
jgi:chromate transporter